MDEHTTAYFEANTARALLAFLAMDAGNAHQRDTLSTLLWPDLPDKEALRNLRQALNRLRNAVGDREAEPPFLQITRQTIAFNPAGDYWLDVTAFEELVAASQQHRHRRLSVCRFCIQRLQEAAELYQGDLLTGFSLDSILFEEWLVVNREQLHRQAMELLDLLAIHHEERGEYEQARHYTRRQIELEPWKEEAHRQLMRVLVLSGQRSAALMQYHTCSRLLEEELRVEPSHETKALYEQLVNEEDVSTLGFHSPVSLHNLPAQATPFVGRKAELTQIARVLNSIEDRLLTLVGPGGIGKTRLALQAARNEVGAFRDGVYFVPLASLSSPELLPAAVAGALEFSFRGDRDPEIQLYNYLQDKEMLLVLDNFEHILAGAGLVAELLRHAPEVRILVVSRERLNLQSERLFEVEGLNYPRAEPDEELAQYSAVRLFVQSARRVRSDFAFSPAEQPCVVRICQLVEGMPLAIELAATWRQALSCQEIAQEIEKSFDFLTTMARDLPERHRSLRGVFDYSWDLLSPKEKAVFSQSSVFQGNFDRMAAEKVTGADPFTLVSLVNKSLLHQVGSPGEETGARYLMHSLSRQYAAEKLAQAAEERLAAQERHCIYYMDFLRQMQAELADGQQRDALEAIHNEIENVRAAWGWAIAHHRIAEVEGASDSLFLFYYMRSWFQEGEQAFGRLVTSWDRKVSGVEANLRGKALAAQGWFAFQLGDHVQGRELLQESLCLLRTRGARAELAFALDYLGAVAVHLGSYDEARELCQEGLAICREIDEHYGAAIALNLLGRVAYMLGDYVEAQQRCEESLALAHEIGNRWSMAFSLDYLGRIAYAQGEYGEAKRLFSASLAVRREMRDRRGIALSLNSLGETAQAIGEYAEAEQLYEDSLVTFEQIGHKTGVVQSLTNLGHMASALEDHERAHNAFLDALQLATEIQATPMALNALVGIASVLAQMGEPVEALALLTLVREHAASTQESRASAERLCEALAAQLAAEPVDPDRGQEQESTINLLLKEMLG